MRRKRLIHARLLKAQGPCGESCKMIFSDESQLILHALGILEPDGVWDAFYLIGDVGRLLKGAVVLGSSVGVYGILKAEAERKLLGRNLGKGIGEDLLVP